MCGIIGFFNPTGKEAWRADDVFQEALFTSQVRGRDSCGVFFATYKKQEPVDMLKAVGTVDSFNQMKQVHKRLYKDFNHRRFVVGHVRSATVGAADDIKAAHPHETKNIHLVHNGTLTYYSGNTHVSDSSAMAQYLEECDGSFEKATEKFVGAWAVVWHDLRTGSLNFVRNAARPLGFVQDTSGVVWFASEPDMMEWVLKRNLRTVAKHIELPERTIITFDKNNQMQNTLLPLIGKDSGSSEKEAPLTFEEFQALPETIRAKEAIRAHRVKKFEDSRLYLAPTPKDDAPEYPVMVPRGATETKAGSQDLFDSSSRNDASTNIKLKEYCGQKIGDIVMLYPLRVRSFGSSGQMMAFGPLVVWAADGPELVPGAEVRARLDQHMIYKDDFMRTHEEILGEPCLLIANISALTWCREAKQLLVHAHEACFVDKTNPLDYGITESEAIKAALAIHIPSPEVEGEEKKPVFGSRSSVGSSCQTDCTSGSTIH